MGQFLLAPVEPVTEGFRGGRASWCDYETFASVCSLEQS